MLPPETANIESDRRTPEHSLRETFRTDDIASPTHSCHEVPVLGEK